MYSNLKIKIMFKTIKREDVKEVLISLLDANGTTSSLDVKRELRKRGFWATQSNVSQLLSNVYTEVQDVVRTNNGSYFEYSYEIEDKDSVVGDNYSDIPNFGGSSTGLTFSFGSDEDCECDNEDVKPKNIKSKVVDSPKLIGDDTYQLTIEHDENTVKIVVSCNPGLRGFGSVIYEVRTTNPYDYNWYLYSTNEDFITRHKAIYYTWKVLNSEVNNLLAYADLRSTKLL